MHRKQLLFGFLVLSLVLVASCSKKGEEQKAPGARKIALPPVGFHGWKSLTLESAYIRLDVVPELGGKIMGYELRGTQILWHDTKKEGYVEKEQGYGFGQKFFNPGGAKVWPAPQGWSGKDEWPGPPDNVLDGAPYEGALADSAITVTSPKDDGEGRTGLQFKHSYSLSPSSSIVKLNLSMSNVVNRPVTWGLWHLATVPVDRNFTVYVPVSKGNWHVIFGEKNNSQWLDVENGLFRVKYDKKVGKVGMRVSEGWAAWHNEDSDIVFVMFFPVKNGAKYPDGGSNFEIWTSGAGSIKINGKDVSSEYSPDTALMELEVMGPLTRLNPGESKTLDVAWAACRCSGVKKVVPGGVIAEGMKLEGDTVTGKFGVFYGGLLQAVYFDRNRKQVGMNNVGEVSPLTEIVISRSKSDFASFAAGIRYQVQSYDKKTVSVLDELMLPR
jgi:hypothetical protein